MRKLALFLLASAISCAPASSGLKPVGASEAQEACPGGRRAWNLSITDLRAERKDTERVVTLIRESLSKSFPGCQWSKEDPGTPTISIEVHRLASDFIDEMFEAQAQWQVSAQTASGKTLTQFEAESSVSRPNYRSSNNERESLREAFEAALKKTAVGLRNLPEVP